MAHTGTTTKPYPKNNYDLLPSSLQSQLIPLRKALRALEKEVVELTLDQIAASSNTARFYSDVQAHLMRRIQNTYQKILGELREPFDSRGPFPSPEKVEQMIYLESACEFLENLEQECTEASPRNLYAEVEYTIPILKKEDIVTAVAFHRKRVQQASSRTTERFHTKHLIRLFGRETTIVSAQKITPLKNTPQ